MIDLQPIRYRDIDEGMVLRPYDNVMVNRPKVQRNYESGKTRRKGHQDQPGLGVSVG